MHGLLLFDKRNPNFKTSRIYLEHKTRYNLKPKEGEMAKDYDLSIHMNPDAKAWTELFRKYNPDCNVPDDMMLAWFSNAMMAMHDYIKGPSCGDHAQFLLDEQKKAQPQEQRIS